MKEQTFVVLLAVIGFVVVPLICGLIAAFTLGVKDPQTVVLLFVGLLAGPIVVWDLQKNSTSRDGSA